MDTAAQPAGFEGWQRKFFTIWTGQAFSLLGSSLVQFALIWWITAETGSATVLAMATLVGLLPQVLLGPFAGALVDRWNRKRVIMTADAIVAFVSLVLAALFFSGVAQVWHVLVVMMIRSTGGAFHWPAMTASTSLMVPDRQLARVSGMNQALYGVMNIVAPPLGALLLGILPMAGILMIDVVTALIAVFSVSLVTIPQPVRKDDAEINIRTVWEDVKVGWRYATGWSGFLALGIIATLLNFLITPAFSLLPILVTRYFGGQALELSALNSAWGLGVVAGGLLLSVWGGFRKKIYTSLMGLVGMGAGILILAVTPANLFWLGVAGIAIAGIMNPIANGPLFAILQSTVAPEMQGRVFTLVGSVSAAMSPLSLLVAGPVADAAGVRVWYLAGGVMTILMAVVAFMIPPVIMLEENALKMKEAAAQ